MFSISKDRNTSSYGILELIADSIDDIKDLPKDIRAGSTVFIIENASVYMLNHNKEWKEI